MLEKLKEWVGSGIVGSIAFAAVSALASWITGSWATIRPFAMRHLPESLLCASVIFFSGALIATLMYHYLDRRHSVVPAVESDLIKDSSEKPKKQPSCTELGPATAAGAMQECPTKTTIVADLTEPESRMAIEIYKSGTLRVGTEWLSIAKSLHDRNVIYRLDASSSGVIEQCDVGLTEDWRVRVGDALSQCASEQQRRERRL